MLGLAWGRRHEATDGPSGTEWVPEGDGAVLGWLLAVLGAPTSDGGPSLPPWLVLDAPRPVRLDAARVAVRQRATALPRDGLPLQLALHHDGRREAIARLLRSVAPPDGEVRTDAGVNIRLDRRAAEVLAAPPVLDGFLPR